ncbi:MAG: hypothetical protein H0X24_23300, partial [Ktedonobacterales bacterium]|nr:hypothetical protein [Ktedonobacterales bacterium]
DTQCGFKCFTRAVAQDVCGRQRLPGFSFDVELLALARARGYHIAEIPIDWYHERHSRVRPLRDTIMMVRDIWRVRQRMQRDATLAASTRAANPEEAGLFLEHAERPMVNAE